MSPPSGAPTAHQSLLEIDPQEFRANFNRRPFLIGHHLCEHPLFTLPSLLALAKRLPARDIEFNAADIPISLEPHLTPHTGLSVEETIRRIEECRSWMVLKYVENDAEYRELLYRCLAEIKPHSEPIAPGMMQIEGFIFITSPNSVTPYHLDAEHNFLLQIRGGKSITQFDGSDRSIVSEIELERCYDGEHRNLVCKEEYLAKSWAFDLQSGFGLHFPATFPHWVRSGPSVSISFSVTFRTPDLERRAMIYNVNSFLRRRGLSPTPVGESPWKDALKIQGHRIWRRARRLLRVR
jgi:hypothetical protein